MALHGMGIVETHGMMSSVGNIPHMSDWVEYVLLRFGLIRFVRMRVHLTGSMP